MRSCLAPTIPARWSRIHVIPLLLAVLLLAEFALPAAAQDLASLVKVYRETPSVARRARVESLASSHPKDQDGALAQLALGITSFEQKDYDRAARYLKGAQARLPKIEDYAVYYMASAQMQAKDQAGIPKQLVKFQTLPIASPLAARAKVLEAKALVDLQNPAEAVRILRERYAELPQPDADLTLATAYEAASDPVNAAAYYQHVYFGYPDTDAAVRAAAAIVLLKNAMGATYPPATPEQILKRGDRWLAAREYKQARQEFASMVADLGGLERDQARVRIGAADYLRGETPAAFRYLQSLDVGRSEADAERLYYLAECQRRMNDHDDMLVTVKRLCQEYPQSPWRLKALVSAANSYLVENRPDIYEPLYKAAYQDFPNDTTAPYSHWKVAWSDYIRRRPEAAEKLREQIEQYPAGPMTGAAMYFLGRLSEGDKDFGAARAYYAKIVSLFPNFYYATLALQRLSEPRLVAVEPSVKVAQVLNGVAFPERRVSADRELSSTTQLRIARARLLATAGLPDLAETELRFGARNDGQPHLLAMELARTAPSAHLGLRYMKSFAPDYLATPFDQMPRRFWELLFPVPYQKDLVRNAKLQNLDACMVAALIRQESEFNPGAISRKNAYGLTQIMPATGRQLARRNGVRRFRTSMLFQPATNLQLGERYLRSMLDQWGGKWEETLASYNAGKTRVDEWLGWNYTFQEPAEFVETIPFTETREYVQAVLRNAAIYRRLYGTALAALPSTDGGTSDRSSTKSAARPAKHKRSRAVS